MVQLRYKPEVKPSSSPPKIAETKPTIASDKPNIPLKPSQIREEGIDYSNVNSFGLLTFKGLRGSLLVQGVLCPRGFLRLWKNNRVSRGVI